MVGPGRPQFVLFGSSIVQDSFQLGGWGAKLAELYDRKVVFLVHLTDHCLIEAYFNICSTACGHSATRISGWNSRPALQVLHQIFPKEAATQPSLVIVYFGGNDSVLPAPNGIGPHVPLQEYIENMKEIALHLKRLSENIRLIFLTAPPVNEAMIPLYYRSIDCLLRKNESLCKYAQALADLCNHLDIKVINLYKAIQQREDWANVCFTDGIHFSPEASKIVVEEILKVLKEADWEPSLHWMSMPDEYAEYSPYGL